MFHGPHLQFRCQITDSIIRLAKVKLTFSTYASSQAQDSGPCMAGESEKFLHVTKKQ